MIECRGRNGWFVLHEAKVQPMHLIREGHVAISISSRMPYANIAPIYLRGPRLEVLELLEKLLREVRNV